MMTNFNIMGVYWKIQFLGEGVHEKPIYRGYYLKRGGLGSLQFSEGAVWWKRGGGDTPMHTMAKQKKSQMPIRILRKEKTQYHLLKHLWETLITFLRNTHHKSEIESHSNISM